MNCKGICWSILIVAFYCLNLAAEDPFIIVDNELPGVAEQLMITIDPEKHMDYGFAYPLTYECSVPIQDSAQVMVRFSAGSAWEQLIENDSSNFVNGQEMVRFDYANQKAFISVAFSSESDSIFIKVVEDGIVIPIRFQEICKFYDNRQTAVTLSADDMAGWSRLKFKRTLAITRSYRLWVTGAINTNGASNSTYDYIQTQLDSGYFEAGCHSRSHPSASPYDDYEGQITGNRDDIIKFLSLPSLWRYKGKEYVYSWIAPHGYVDDTIESILGREKFLVNRLYKKDYFGYTDWDDENGYYEPIGVARAFDPPREVLGWGIGSNDIDDLNGAFDQSYESGEVFHTMCHPNVVEWDKDYPRDHLEYISNRVDVWYAGLGHVFLYHYGQENYTTLTTSLATSEEIKPASFLLSQNYPNPFNPTTTISYNLPENDWVELGIYDLSGQKVATLVSGQQSAGSHSVLWDGSDFASGVYIYSLRTAAKQQIKKMILVK